MIDIYKPKNPKMGKWTAPMPLANLEAHTKGKYVAAKGLQDETLFCQSNIHHKVCKEEEKDFSKPIAFQDAFVMILEMTEEEKLDCIKNGYSNNLIEYNRIVCFSCIIRHIIDNSLKYERQYIVKLTPKTFEWNPRKPIDYSQLI